MSLAIPGQVYTTAVCLLIAFIALSSQYYFLIPGLQNESLLSQLKSLAPFNILVGLVFYNYYLAVSTDPGRVPSSWQVPDQYMIPTSEQRRAQGITGPRFCKTCDAYKPPRAHHCRICRRCVLKMDHHCPWINNCVGYNNYSHFFRFIFFVNFACAYVLWLLVIRINRMLNDIRNFQFESEPTTTEAVFMVLDFVAAFIVLFCVLMLTVYHCYLLARNQTTIESWERSKVKRLISTGKIPLVHYPYDLGVYTNICAVLGKSPLLWLWPQRNPREHTGISFPLRRNIDPALQYYWPPRDPDELRPSIFSKRYRTRDLPLADRDDVSDTYYDSGSCMTDSEPEYTLDDEERSMRRVVGHSSDNCNTDSSHHHHQQQQRHHYPLHGGYEPERYPSQPTEDESVPLSTFLVSDDKKVD
ncbi:DHHC palmitoyltransferase-domain-containing protein [Syncephalastrum racemosum]|uniref:Palmitoyltransferase PFA4 n=1 Tax=Syncephalastrum racemosum TaxID=13706 RepID=A0A1X2HF20_SYNRA|nr:DHHC palmitoyltransferase-domain-containing protein [Syncephalastrum racemosum]